MPNNYTVWYLGLRTANGDEEKPGSDWVRGAQKDPQRRQHLSGGLESLKFLQARKSFQKEEGNRMCRPEEAVRVCITRCTLREDSGRCPGMVGRSQAGILGEEHGNYGFYLQWGDVGEGDIWNCGT